MRELIRGYCAATFETARENGNIAQVITDLSGFRHALDNSQALAVALTDSSITPEVRRDIAVDLVSEKATSEATALLSFTVRYERAGELLSTINSLLVVGEEVMRVADEHELAGIEPQAVQDAHAAARERIRGFAERVLQELKVVGEIDEVEDELFRFARILDDNASLRRALGDINDSYARRVAIVSDLVSSQVQQATLRIMKYVLRAGRIRDLVGIFEWLVELAAAERGRRVAEVRSAVELDGAERDRLAAALGRLVERPVEVRVIHDPTVIGGMLVSVGDLVIDGTVRIRFERLRDLLAQAS